MASLTLSSPAFKHQSPIPEKHACDGDDVNPALIIRHIPAGARSLALIMDDPDAPRGVWVHWVIWNIDPATTEIKENSVPAGARQGVNDFRATKYGGPCPPPGKPHRYFFKLYALDTELDLTPGATKAALESAMKGHILEQAEVVGRYGRT